MSDARSIATIDLTALRHNASRLARAAGGAELMAVVKANGYGHGAVPCAQTALDGGAGSLAVASVEEAEELRLGGVSARILIMSPLAGAGFDRALALRHVRQVAPAARVLEVSARSGAGLEGLLETLLETLLEAPPQAPVAAR